MPSGNWQLFSNLENKTLNLLPADSVDTSLIFFMAICNSFSTLSFRSKADHTVANYPAENNKINIF